MPTSAPECPFCDIIDREDPDAREVFRDEHVVAFFPLEPATLGHTLVVPRKHVADIWELDAATASNLSGASLAVAAAIKRALQPEGLNVIQSNGEAATQTVEHLHVHLVPRWTNDAIGRIWPPETSYTERQKDAAWQRLKRECEAMSNATSPVVPLSPEDRRKHLEFVQGVIARMSEASSKTKSWLLPVVTAAYGYALTSRTASVALLGVAAVVLFAIVDANYLNQERSFRQLYKAVARGDSLPPYCLEPDLCRSDTPNPHAIGKWRRWIRALRKWVPHRAVWASWAIAPFYGGLVGIGVWIWVAGRTC